MSKKYAEIGVLVTKAQAGSKAAAETLLLTFKPLILATISAYVYDKTQLEDAYQEACVIFMERLKDFKSKRPDYFPAYIKRQLFYTFVQKAKKRPQTSVQAVLSLDMPSSEGVCLAETLSEAEAEESDADRSMREIKQDSDLRLLKLRVAQLPKVQRECVQAHYYRGQTYQAIARDRGVSEQCVARTLSKAMKGLRKAYGIEKT
ncbi:sigma-70 family RNA polymerase sigma factor [Eubacterium sp. 1001713B170207_170306_E7]|uniref:RNA polymerase sigma factor n=1 Tax=Eubacterium sp. 1001713B170207_170306_E7 TaxID=2787097 RepID=UPI001896E7C4|nr:sigma-70 family RNA polymerase sigma factor [Eubacterium sp. 1001713B170207_170306_E7]